MITMVTPEVFLIISMILLIVIGNTTICCVIYRVRQLHCPSSFLLVNLAVNEILVGVFLLPFTISFLARQARTVGRAECNVLGFFQHASSTVSVLTLLAVSTDRYLAIISPLTYKAWVTGRKTVLCIACIWSYALFSGCYPFFGWSSYKFVRGLWLCESDYHKSLSFTYFKFTTMYFIPLISIIFIYASILRVSWRHSRQIRSEVDALRHRDVSAVLEPGLGEQVSGVVISGQYCLRKPHSAIRTEIKTALILAAIVGVLFVVWTPYVLVNLWSFHSGKRSSVTLQSIVSRLYYVNAVINPYLYGYLNRVIKREFKRLWQRTRRFCVRLRAKQVHPSIAPQT